MIYLLWLCYLILTLFCLYFIKKDWEKTAQLERLEKKMVTLQSQLPRLEQKSLQCFAKIDVLSKILEEVKKQESSGRGNRNARTEDQKEQARLRKKEWWEKKKAEKSGNFSTNGGPL